MNEIISIATGRQARTTMNFSRICSKIINFSFHALFFLVPLVLCPLTFELFEYNKMMLTYAFSIIIGLSWGLKMVAEKRFSVTRTPLDIPFLLFLGSQIASTFFSIDPHTSLFGYYSRFHGGLLSTLCYLLLYYALVSNFSEKDSFPKLVSLLKTILFSGALVTVYGLLQHPNPLFQDASGRWHGIDHQYWFQEVELRIFSTIGQPNWLAAYLGMLIPLAISLIMVTSDKADQTTSRRQGQILRPKLFYLILAVALYWCLLYTNSRAGVAGFLAALLAFLVFLFLKHSSFKKTTLSRTNLFFLGIILLTFGVLTLTSGRFLLERFAGILPLTQKKTSQVSSSPEPETESEDLRRLTAFSPAAPIIPPDETGRIRNIVWRGGLEIFKHYPLFGSGVETFAYSYYRFRPQAHNLTTEWDFLYNKAHNEYLNFLATTGIVGLFSYLLIIAVFGFWFFRYYQKANQRESVLVLGLFSAYLGYLIQNVYGFSVVSVATFFFLFPAFCFLLTSKLPTCSFSLIRKPFWSRLTSLAMIAAAGLGLLTLAKMWLADTNFARAHQLAEAGYFDASYSHAAKAISLNPREPVYYDQLAYNAAVLATAEKEATLAALLAEEAVLASQKALTTSPLNLNLWKTAIKVLYQLGSLNPEFYQKALEAAKIAVELSPTEPKLPYNLGLIYLQLEETEKAIESFQKSIQLKPDLRDSHYALAVVYHQQATENDDKTVKQELLEKAVGELNYILAFIDPGDVEVQEKLRDWKESL